MSFFVREPKTLEHPENRRNADRNILGVNQCPAQFRQRNVGVLLDQFDQKILVGTKLANA